MTEQVAAVAQPAATPVVAPVTPAAQPVVTPAAATAQPVVAQPVVAVEQPAKVVSTSEREALNGFIEEAGLGIQDTISQVTKDGTVSPAILKALVDKHGERVAALLASQMETLATVSKAEAAKRDQTIYSLVENEFKGVTEQSGKDSWNELATWAKANVPNETRREINQLLAQGGLQAELATKHLISLFKANPGETSAKAELLEADGTSDQSGQLPMDKATYQRELRALLDKGHDYDKSPQIQQLNARRTKAIQRGIN